MPWKPKSGVIWEHGGEEDGQEAKDWEAEDWEDGNEYSNGVFFPGNEKTYQGEVRKVIDSKGPWAKGTYDR